MARIGTIKFPGGELSTTSQVIDHTEKTGPDEPPPPDLPEGLTLSLDQQKLVTDFIQAQKTTSRIWEYRYFDFYFVRDTQLVLDWLVHNRPSIDLFHAMWMPAIPKATDLTSVIFFQLAENLVPEGLNGVVVAGLGRVSSELAVQEPPSEPQRRAKVR